MDLRFLPVLVLGFCLSSSAPTPEECEKMMTPRSLEDPSWLLNRWNFIMGFANHSIYHELLKSTQSSWTKLDRLPDSQELAMYQSNKMNEKCFYSKTNVSIEGNTAKIFLINVTSDLQILPIPCDTCVVLKVNSVAKDINNILSLLNYNFTVNENFSNEAIYLMSSKSSEDQSDLDYFKTQAACFGFTGEPDFEYNLKNGFCDENEGPHI